MAFSVSLGAWETRQKGGPTHRPYSCHDDAQDVGHDVHQNTGALDFPDGSAQRGFLGPRPLHLFVSKDSKPVQEEEVENQGPHSHLLLEATPMANLARELRTTRPWRWCPDEQR